MITILPLKNPIRIRLAKWIEFDKSIEKWKQHDSASAFIQEITKGGLWSVQKLVIPKERHYSFLYRFFFNPPEPHTYEPYYNGWPGDHRGWMRFQSAEEARDFYRFCEGFISFEEYKKIPSKPLSDIRINLDSDGKFLLTESSQEAGLA